MSKNDTNPPFQGGGQRVALEAQQVGTGAEEPPSMSERREVLSTVLIDVRACWRCIYVAARVQNRNPTLCIEHSVLGFAYGFRLLAGCRSKVFRADVSVGAIHMATTTAHTDDFPSTKVTFMCGLMEEGAGGRERLSRTIMARYHGPLLAYATRAIPSYMADPHEVVNEFMVSRLPRPDYFAKWRASGLPFRRWLLNGIHFCAREVRRSNGRASRGAESFDAVEAESAFTLDAVNNAESAFDRQFAMELLARCVDQVQSSLRAKGRQQDWQSFWRHHVDHVPYRTLSRETGIAPSALNSNIRAVTREIRLAVRFELMMHGADDAEIASEFSAMMEALRP